MCSCAGGLSNPPWPWFNISGGIGAPDGGGAAASGAGFFIAFRSRGADAVCGRRACDLVDRRDVADRRELPFAVRDLDAVCLAGFVLLVDIFFVDLFLGMRLTMAPPC